MSGFVVPAHAADSAFLAQAGIFFATLQNLSGKGLTAPRDVSLVVLDDHPDYKWFDPEVSHTYTDTKRVVPRVVQWVDHITNGREDLRETVLRAKFVTGGTIGPVPE